MRHHVALHLGVVLSLGLVACTESSLLPVLRATEVRGGPRVVWDLSARPVPNIPLPNDVATWPDPGSPTGLRLNASMLSPTAWESRDRAQLDQLDGWGTFSPITVAFDAPIDTDSLMFWQGPDRLHASDWPAHAIYLVDLETGLPVPLDLNGGSTTFNLRDTDAFGESDPRGGQSNLLFETVEEDRNGNGVLDPGEDTDFDGVLDHPNTRSGALDPTNPNDAYDNTLWFYERETNTLVLRPMVPLHEDRRYAVVVTTRVTGTDGKPVRSPFDDVVHVSQRSTLVGLPALLARHHELYGDAGDGTWNRIAVAWSFTTQSVTRDLVTLREGLYGRGVFSRLGAEFPPDLVVARAASDPAVNPACGAATFQARPYVAPIAAFKSVAQQLAETAFGLDAASTAALLASFDNIDHFVVAFVRAPYYLGDPNVQGPTNLFHVDTVNGTGDVGADYVPIVISIPKETAAFHQPFPVAIYGHGYTSNHLESLGFAGYLAGQGVATVGFLATGHGIQLGAGQDILVYGLFDSECIGGTGNAAVLDRARDQNGDGLPDSGADFWSAYLFHTRDAIRQSVLDEVAVIRALRALDGTRLAASGTVPHPRHAPRKPFTDVVGGDDFDGDGRPNLAGDFDGNGTPDIGGPGNATYVWGQSLGAALAGTLAGLEPYAQAAAPSSGAGGLLDVGLRTTESSVKEAVVTRLMGPVLLSRPSSGPTDDSGCAAGELSLSEMVVDLNERVYVEVACLPSGAAPRADGVAVGGGDAVVVRNFHNREVRCAAVDAEGRFRVGVPSSAGDYLEVDVYDGAALDFDYATCAQRPGTPVHRLELSQTTFGVGQVPAMGARPPHTCRNCARYQQQSWELGDPLVAVTEGLGLRRQSPELRRFMTLAQLGIESADPVNWAPHVFLDPLPLPDNHPRDVLVMHSLGDTVVPIASGMVYARAAGVLPFAPSDAPDFLVDYRAPAGFVSRYGQSSPNEVMISHYVIEGLARLDRISSVPGHPDWLFDVDDLSEGLQRYSDTNGHPPVPPDPGASPARLAPPLRWVRESRAVTDPRPGLDDVWNAPLSRTSTTGISGVVTFMIEPGGEHGFDPPQPSKTWDEGVYLSNLLGWYFRSGGTDLLYHSSPATHRCLVDSSCIHP